MLPKYSRVDEITLGQGACGEPETVQIPLHLPMCDVYDSKDVQHTLGFVMIHFMIFMIQQT